jgi:hypothetical protein
VEDSVDEKTPITFLRDIGFTNSMFSAMDASTFWPPDSMMSVMMTVAPSSANLIAMPVP